MDPYEWVDLEDFAFYPASSNAASPKGGICAGAGAEPPFKPGLKLDPFHQTIVKPEVNMKERLQAEDVFLVESEWKRLTESHPDDLLCMLSHAGLFLRVSDNCKKITRQRPDQLIGINIVNYIHINELPSFYDQLNLVVNAGKTCRLAHQFRSGENWLELESTFYPMFTKLLGDFRCVIMHARVLGGAKDVMEKSQKQLSRKFISRLTMEGIYTYISPSVTTILGLAPQEVLGRSVYEFFPPDELQLLSNVHAKLKATSSEQIPLIHNLKRKDGLYATVETLFNVFSNPVSGSLECILCTTTELQQDDPLDLEGTGIIELLQKEVDELKKLLHEKNLELEQLRAEGRERQEAEGDGEKKKRKRKIRTDLICEECGTTESPEWRKGPSGHQSLCNACGLRFSKKMKQQKIEGFPSGQEVTAAEQLEFHKQQIERLQQELNQSS